MEHKSEKPENATAQPEPSGASASDNTGDGSPPGYSRAATAAVDGASLGQCVASATPGLPPVDVAQYLVPGATISKDGTTVTVAFDRLCTDPHARTEFLAAQAALPLRPQVRITGSHNAYGERKVDFDVRLNLMRYIIRVPGQGPPLNYVKLVEPKEPAYRGDMRKTVTPHPDGGMLEWARIFCQSSAANRAFVLEREVPNWNTPLLEGRIRNLLASLRYQGQISISFPVSHTHVIVTPSSQSAGIVPRLMSLVTETRRFAVVRAIWPFANLPASSLASAMEDRGGPVRVCAVQGEQEWWDVWGGAIAEAVADRREGWVTVEHVLERIMGPRREVSMTKNWGVSSW